MALAFGACSDDDEPNTPGVMKATKLNYEATIQLSQDLLKVADIKAYYIDANGNVASETITTTQWTKAV